MIGAKLGILFYSIHETFHLGGSEAGLANLNIFSWGLAKWRGQETLRFNYAPPLNQIYSSPTN